MRRGFNHNAQHLNGDTWLRDAQDKILAMEFSGHRYLERRWGSFRFEQKELQMLDSGLALLNDICLNGLAAVLQGLFKWDPNRGHYAHQVAIFSTYDLNRIRYQAPDTELWRNTCRAEYWSKETWILPIHRQSERHWVLAVIYPKRREIHLFDSLARNSSWSRDIKVNVVIYLKSSLFHSIVLTSTFPFSFRD